MNNRITRHYFLLLTLFALVTLAGGCTVEASKVTPNEVENSPRTEAKTATKGATIEMEPNGPGDTVRVFYNTFATKSFARRST